MKSIVNIICCAFVLSWVSSATAAGVTVQENANAVILESTPAPTMPASAVPATQRGPVKVYYDKVDRTRAEQRLESNALRAKKRTEEARKDATERATRVQQTPPAP